jgi:alcohol dehydrogenase, propanol-preferring
MQAIYTQPENALEFLALAGRLPIRTHTQPFPLAEASRALAALREGELNGAAVLIP